MRLLIFLLLFLFVVTARSSPQDQVTGTVTDKETGEPLRDVNVVIEGTTTGTATDENGFFRMSKPVEGTVIAFSFVGYAIERINYIGQSILSVSMTQEVTALDDVVVIGYGTIKKADLTGSVSSVKADMIEKTRPVTVQSILQGTIPGVFVTSNDGSPGSEAVIRIRGIGTINNNDPIYVVDGMIVDNLDKSLSGNNMGFLNPMDIASIDILKDASAQAIYGSRGANGVVLITTKKGSEGAPKVTFTSIIGIEIPPHTADLLDADQYKDYKFTLNYNGFLRQYPDSIISPDSINKEIIRQYNKGYNTQWMEEVMQKNVSQNYDFSMTGGTKDIRYMASAGYLDKKGIILNSGFKRYSFRLNTDFRLSKNVTIGENLGISSYVRSGDWNGSKIIWDAMHSSPLSAVYKPEGTVDITDPYYEMNQFEGDNAVFTAGIIKKNAAYLDIVGNMYAEVSLLRNLKLRSSWGFNLYTKDYKDFIPTYRFSPEQFNYMSSLEMSHHKANGWVWENTISWNKTLDNHSINALIGYTSEYTRADQQTSSKKGFPGNEPEMQTFDAGMMEAVVKGTYNVFTMISYLGRVNYSFSRKYMLTFSLRRDGSSKFGEGHRWGTFPSFSAGWKIDEENFFKNINPAFLNHLKIRAGWGRIGNSSLPAYYAFVSQVGSGPEYRSIFNETSYHGSWLTTIGRQDISWETTEQSNIGLEIGLFKNSVSLTADYFIKNTRDMLVQSPVVYYAGYQGAAMPFSNIGMVQNKGLEISAGLNKSFRKLRYGVNVNFTSFRNKVLEVGPGDLPVYTNYDRIRTDKGNPIAYYYGWMVDGVFQTEEEVNAYNKTASDGVTLLRNTNNIKPGDFRFKDVNNDQIIDGRDRTKIGDQWPDFILGFNLNLGFRNFDIESLFQGTYGNDIIDNWHIVSDEWKTNTYEYHYKNAWRGEGTTNSFPVITSFDPNWNYRFSNYYVEDASYLRLKNLQFRYSFPDPFCEKLKISSARIWISATNLVTLTGFHGNDPETGASGTTLESGINSNNYFPKSREVSLGLSVSF